ncbi:MAG: hypothetical protein AUI54_01290 [Acidobacteria bacterium 13_1_40CM_2_56_5]|nr:MAG: hypothetical protein AUI54_01290 [Acidobacteria bacterium 13_1_40CM_2_56_5]
MDTKPIGIGVLECHSINFGEEIDPARRHAKLKSDTRLIKILFSELGGRGAKAAERIRTDQEVFNVLFVEYG